MELNLPPQVRMAIYVVVVIGTAVIVPLHSENVVSDLLFNVWTSLSAAASALAAYNVGKAQ